MIGICALGRAEECTYELQLRLDSIHPTFNNFLMTAYIYYLDDQFEKAREYTQKMYELNKNNFYSLMGMAVVLARQEKFLEAVPWLDRAAEINPTHPDLLLLAGIHYLFDN